MNVSLTDTPPANPCAGAMWVDSHVHFDSFEEAGMLDRVLSRARHAGVKTMVAIGGSDTANERAVRLSRSHSGAIYAVVGYDRDKAGDDNDIDALAAFVKVETGTVVGIGESGLDYHYEPDTAPAQKRLFARMLELAATTGRPIVVHSRDADNDTLDMLKDYTSHWPGDPAYPGVLHCFTGSYAFARKLLDIGFLISFSGILTFKNAAELRDCARRIPLDRLLIETDAPYLAPVPHRGKTNEPGWVPCVAETLATILPDALQHIATVTSANAGRLFGFTKETS